MERKEKMKYILPKKLRFSKKEQKDISKFAKKLKKIRPWFIIGLFHGAVIIGILLLYHFLK